MTTVTATHVSHPEHGWPAHWTHYRLTDAFTQIEHDHTRTVFTCLVVAHLPDPIDGTPTTRIMPAWPDGSPFDGADARTLEGRHEPAAAVRWWLQRVALPHHDVDADHALTP